MKLIIASLLLLLSACSSWSEFSFWSFGDSESDQTFTRSNNSVELYWKVPFTPVESFEISYGDSSEYLDRTILLRQDELEIIEHQTLGQLFRYQFKIDIDSQKPIFISLVAISGELRSEPSEVKRIDPVSSQGRDF